MTFQFNKTRIAPTPSGYLHLGNALSFALTASLAKQTHAKILLRIDDLDRDRINPSYVQDIFDTLNFLEIPCNDGPRNMQEYETVWSQLYRMDIYRTALLQLKQNDAVYACQCSRTQIQTCTCRDKNIPLDTPNTSWRLRTDERELSIKTLNDGVVETTLPAAMKDFIVKKKDGYPAYQLTSLVDDLHYGVDLIIRGEDLLPSTIAQHYLADVLQLPGFQNITFHHHPLLMESADKKLSKSAGATSIKYLREQGKAAMDVYGQIGTMIGTRKDLRSFENFASLI
jgi:glutamyl/glutaminyl-tRNA synthetase